MLIQMLLVDSKKDFCHIPTFDIVNYLFNCMYAVSIDDCFIHSIFCFNCHHFNFRISKKIASSQKVIANDLFEINSEVQETLDNFKNIVSHGILKEQIKRLEFVV